MRKSLLACALFVALTHPLTAHTQPRPAESNPHFALDSIAARWSGSRARPVCQSHGPRGEYLGPIPGSVSCRWAMAGAAQGEIIGQRNAMFGLGMITWQRTLPDSTFVARLADSLGVALRAAGMSEYPCRFGGRRWLGPQLGIELAPAPPRKNEPQRIAVFATRIPAALPSFSCPSAPHLSPPRPPAPHARRGAA